VIVIDTKRSWTGTTRDWTRSRGAILLRLLVARGLPVAAAFAVMTTLLAHLWREVGGGRYEFDNNPGNIKASSSWAGLAAYRTNVQDGRQLYRAYASIAEGLDAYLRHLENARYGAALAQLVADRDGARWYAAVMRAGYHPFSEEALREWRLIHRRIVGA
jgi:fido (protein-threonine AMPylation protein)